MLNLRNFPQGALFINSQGEKVPNFHQRFHSLCLNIYQVVSHLISQYFPMGLSYLTKPHLLVIVLALEPLDNLVSETGWVVDLTK